MKSFTHTHTPRPPTAVQMATSRTCALAPLPSAERTRRELDAAGLLDTEVRAFRCDHPTTAEPALALPLVSDCILNEKPSEGKNTSSSNTATAAAATIVTNDQGEQWLTWAGDTLPVALLTPPHRKRGAYSALQDALARACTKLALNQCLVAALTAEAALPRRWEKLGNTILFAPKGLFDAKEDPAGVALHTELSVEQRDTILAAVAAELGAQRLGVQGCIEESLHRKSTARIIWARTCRGADDHSAGDGDGDGSGWVEHRENGIIYGLDVTRNMFSSGNGTEKTRVARRDCSEEVVVDLYAGIGYFTLPYLVHARAMHLHACEWDEDALHALKFNLSANGVAERCTVHPGDNIAAATTIPNVAHRVNLGLIPSSEAGWPVAVAVLRPEGGTLHVHANVGASSEEESAFCAHLTARLEALAAAAGRTPAWRATVCHIERVKSYAPKLNHVVVDVVIGPEPGSGAPMSATPIRDVGEANS